MIPRVWRVRLATLDRDVVLAAVVFAVLRFWSVGFARGTRFPDSGGYFHVDLFGHALRFWTVPAFYTALPDDRARVAAQVVVGIISWTALALMVARSLVHPLVARLGALAVFALGLSVQVTEWDEAILSESLATSLTVLLIAVLLNLRLRRTQGAAAAVVLVLALWAFTRQFHAIAAVFLCLGGAAYVLVRARRFAVVGVALLLLAAWSGFDLSQARQEAHGSAHNLIVLRLLHDADGPSFLQRHGMPDLKALEAESRSTYLGVDAPAFKDPKWNDWVSRHWASTYVDWIVGHPLTDAKGVVSDFRRDLAGYPLYTSARRVAPPVVRTVLWDPSGRDLPLWGALALLAAGAAVALRRPLGVGRTALALVVGSLAWYVLGWHLAAAELVRVLIPVGAALRVSLFLLLLAGVDALVARSRLTRR